MAEDAARTDTEESESSLSQRKDEVIAQAKEAAERGKVLKERWDRSPWGRAAKRFTTQNGMVLSAGIAYFSLTSVAAGLVIATTLATVFVASDETLRTSLLQYLGDAVPGLIQTDDAAGLIDPASLGSGAVTVSAGLVGVVSFFILVNTASRYVRGLRTSLRTMLGREVSSPVQGKIRDFIALFALVVIALVGLAIQVIASGAAEWFASIVGLEVTPWGIRLIGAGAVLIADMLFAALALILLGGARWSRRLVWVVLVSAVAIGVLRQIISLLVGGVTSSAVLAPFAAIFTLLIFVDYVNRVLLVCAAWLGAATTPEHEGDSTSEPAVLVHESSAAKDRTTPVTTRRAVERNGA